LRAREAVMQLFRPHLHALGLTDQQGRILRVLAERKRIEMRELSAQTCIHPASLSRMIPRMDARGIVRRSRDQADARRVMVAITARGLALFRVIAPESIAIYAGVAAAIGATRMRALHRSLDALIVLAPDAAADARVRPRRRVGAH
jgi:homoprotocatechuate degradation regulator HpaR